MLFGIYAYFDIAKEMNPDIKIPYLFVTSSLRGISPGDGERLLIRPMESSLRSIEGLKNFSAFAVDGSVRIVLEFEAGFDSVKAKESVKDQIDQIISNIPSDATRPSVTEVNLSTLPVLNIGISGKLPYRTLVNIGNKIKSMLEAVPGVLSVDTSGIRSEVTEVIIRPADIAAYGITPYEVAQIISKNNIVISSGKITKTTGEYSFRIPGAIESAKDIAAIPIRSNNGSIISLKDIADVRMTYSDPVKNARINGENCVVLEVSKRLGSNLINTIFGVKRVIEEAKKILPSDVSLIYSQDQSSEIMDMLSELQNSIILAVILVIIICTLFMGKNAAIIVSFAIPLSFLMGIFGIYILGYTFNIVVLFSLIMSIGMLVDDTIVVVECADRKMSTGIPVSEAFHRSAYEMFWPVVTSTFTKIAVFLPLLFWPGVVGEFMKYMPITVIMLLLSSLVVSLLFVPVIASVFNLRYDKSSIEIERINAIEAGNIEKLGKTTKLYVNLLKRVLEHPKKVVIISTIFLLLGSFAFFKFGAGMIFFPKVDSNHISVVVRARGSFSINERDNLVNQVEAKIIKMPEIKVIYTKAGDFSSGAGTKNAPDKIGDISVELVDWHKRKKSKLIIEDIRNLIGDIPGVLIDVSEKSSGPSSGSDIQIDFVHENLDLLKKEANKAVAFMQNTPGFLDSMNTASTSQNQFAVKIKKDKAMMYGVDLFSIGVVAQMVSSGAYIGKYRVQSSKDEIDIIARFPESDRTLKYLQNAFVMSNLGKSFPINEFITVEPEQRINRINRAHGGRVVSVIANVDRQYIVSERLTVLQKFLQNSLNREIKFVVKGEAENSGESQKFLLHAFVLAIFLMIIVLIYEFNSFYRVIIVLSAVFLSTTCVFLGLFLIHYPFGIVMGGVGVISLAGIIVNNNILLLDAYQHNVEHYDKSDAIIRSAISRLRAIFVTAVCTGVGLIPMIAKMGIDFINFRIFFDSPSSQYWFDLSITVVGGLVFATFLTLFFTPAFLSVRKSK